MSKRKALLVGMVLMASPAGLGGVPWHGWPVAAALAETAAGRAGGKHPAEPALPIPPVPPRVAQGKDYDRCLAAVNVDPAGASSFADAWQATGGGDGADHCRALAEIALGAPEKGAELLEKLAGASNAEPEVRAVLFGQAGQAWLMAGDAGRAFGADTLALSLTPDDADLLVDRSIASANLERYDGAAEDLTHALSVDPRRVDALVFRGAAWRHLDRLDQAQNDIDRALAQDPDNPDALLERGILRQRRGDRDGARRDWERAINLSPDTATGDVAQQNLALLEAGPAGR